MGLLYLFTSPGSLRGTARLVLFSLVLQGCCCSSIVIITVMSRLITITIFVPATGCFILVY